MSSEEVEMIPVLLDTPDVTPAQIIAIVQAVVALVVAFGVGVSDELQSAIVQLSTALVVFLPLADAHLRNGRARGSAQRMPF